MKTLPLLLFFLLLSLESRCQLWGNRSAILKFDIRPKYELGKHKRIIIWDVANQTGDTDPHTNDITEELSNAVTRMGDIELVDRRHMDKLIKELQLHESGFVDEKTIKKFGKFLGSGLILIGRVQKDDYKDEIIQEPSIIPIQGCSTTHHRLSTYSIHFNFKLIDIETAQVLFSKTIQSNMSQKTNKYYCETPPDLSQEVVYAQCIEDIGTQFSNLFHQHKKEYNVEFQSHSKFKQDLEKAITYLNVDEFDKAYGIFKNIASAQVLEKAKSKALYNLSLIQFYLGDYGTALETAKEGYITDSGNDACRQLWDTCKQVIATK